MKKSLNPSVPYAVCIGSARDRVEVTIAGGIAAWH